MKLTKFWKKKFVRTDGSQEGGVIQTGFLRHSRSFPWGLISPSIIFEHYVIPSWKMTFLWSETGEAWHEGEEEGKE